MTNTQSRSSLKRQLLVIDFVIVSNTHSPSCTKTRGGARDYLRHNLRKITTIYLFEWIFCSSFSPSGGFRVVPRVPWNPGPFGLDLLLRKHWWYRLNGPPPLQTRKLLLWLTLACLSSNLGKNRSIDMEGEKFLSQTFKNGCGFNWTVGMASNSHTKCKGLFYA